jgi:hypothetical protein
MPFQRGLGNDWETLLCRPPVSNQTCLACRRWSSSPCVPVRRHHALFQFPPPILPAFTQARAHLAAAHANGGPRRADQRLPSRMHRTLAFCVCLCAPSLTRWWAHRSDIHEQACLGRAPCGCPRLGRSIARRAPQPLPLTQPPCCICGVVLLMRGLLCNAPPLLPTHTVSHLNVRAPSDLVHAVRIAEPLSSLHPARGTPCILASHAHSFPLMEKKGAVHAMKARRRFSV